MKQSPAAAIDFETYFCLQYPRIVGELDVLIGDRDLARDIAQEAFIRQHIKWSVVSKFDKPGAWVRKVAIRLAFRTMRRRSRDVLSATVDAEVEAPTVPTELILDVRAAVLQLPKRQRAAVVLHYYRDLPLLAVADAIGCSESTVKSHLQRARQRLAELLAAYAPCAPPTARKNS